LGAAGSTESCRRIEQHFARRALFGVFVSELHSLIQDLIFSNSLLRRTRIKFLIEREGTEVLRKHVSKSKLSSDGQRSTVGVRRRVVGAGASAHGSPPTRAQNSTSSSSSVDLSNTFAAPSAEAARRMWGVASFVKMASVGAESSSVHFDGIQTRYAHVAIEKPSPSGGQLPQVQ
jgi:hypothetical protein